MAMTEYSPKLKSTSLININTARRGLHPTVVTVQNSIYTQIVSFLRILQHTGTAHTLLTVIRTHAYYVLQFLEVLRRSFDVKIFWSFYIRGTVR